MVWRSRRACPIPIRRKMKHCGRGAQPGPGTHHGNSGMARAGWRADRYVANGAQIVAEIINTDSASVTPSHIDRDVGDKIAERLVALALPDPVLAATSRGALIVKCRGC